MDLIATLFYLLIPSTENLSRLQRVILSRLRIIEVAAVVYRIGESAAVVRKQLMALRSAEQLTPSITHPCTNSAACDCIVHFAMKIRTHLQLLR